jgi:hypothetical protein
MREPHRVVVTILWQEITTEGCAARLATAETAESATSFLVGYHLLGYPESDRRRGSPSDVRISRQRSVLCRQEAGRHRHVDHQQAVLDELMGRLYADPQVRQVLARHHVARRPPGGSIWQRFPVPVPDSAELASRALPGRAPDLGCQAHAAEGLAVNRDRRQRSLLSRDGGCTPHALP